MAHTWKDERFRASTNSGRDRNASNNRRNQTSNGDSPVLIKVQKYDRNAEKRKRVRLENGEN